MRSIPVVGALGLTAVSFLSFFLIGQHHPFGSEASTSGPSTLSSTTTVTQSVATSDCTAPAGSAPTCTSTATLPASEAELRAALEDFADNLRGDIAVIVDSLRAVAGLATSALPAAASVAPAPEPAAPEPALPALDEAVEETVAQALGRASDALEAALPGTVEVPPVGPVAPPLQVLPTDEESAATLRQAIEAQAQATIAQARAAAQTQAAAPIAPSLAPTETTPPAQPSSARAQTDPGCVVEESQGDNWSRSAVRCFNQEVRTTGASTSSVTTATSSVSVATTTGGAGVP